MTERKCRFCGAPFVGFVCEHCGALGAALATLEDQRQALDDYRQIVARSAKAQQIQLLKSGFLPDDSALLINAGLQCVSLIDPYEVMAGRSDAAIGRLESVVMKLRLLPQDDETRRAIASFGERIDAYKHKAKRDTFYGLMLLGLIAAALAYFMFGR